MTSAQSSCIMWNGDNQSPAKSLALFPPDKPQPCVTGHQSRVYVVWLCHQSGPRELQDCVLVVVSLYCVCSITVLWLSSYCPVTVKLLSCDSHITVLWLSNYCAVTVTSLSCFCQVTGHCLSCHSPVLLRHCPMSVTSLSYVCHHIKNTNKLIK